MGQLLYGSPPEVFEVDDRTLAHVEVVILAKLRRNENFAVTLERTGGGLSTIWVSTASTLQLRFDGEQHPINRAWLETLIDSANTPAGMKVEAYPPDGPA
ncbi:MAG: hypothetical protein ABJA94_03375 [Rhodoglobus sp.]